MPMIINPFYMEISQTKFCSMTVFFTSLAKKKKKVYSMVTAEILENTVRTNLEIRALYNPTGSIRVPAGNKRDSK